MDLQVIPETIAVRATDSVLDKVIVWLSDPEGRRSLVSVKARPAAFHHHDQVAVQVVLFLNGILNEDVVTLDIVDNVVCHSQVIRTM
jgi:hypothetical protein